MADDNTVIEGTVKFRDGKKWKSRWCVVRRLSPVADCLHLQLYRDAKERYKKRQTKASLSLQQYLGLEAGFTLDKESNTLAIICQDVTAVLALETRERLMQWQVKVGGRLGEPRHYLVMVGASGVGGAANKLPVGPARLHVQSRKVALTAGVPPRLLGLWDLAHLRRYGVVEGRFCFEGGSHCGKGEGLHVLMTDEAREITHAFDLAAQGKLSPRKRPLTLRKNIGVESPKSHKAYRPGTRLSELATIDDLLPQNDFNIFEESRYGEDAGAVSPYWPPNERNVFHDMGLGDTLSVNETIDGTDTIRSAWNGSNNVTLERCVSCMSKLGALSRSSTAALTPGATHFSPAWTMEAVHETTNPDTVSECELQRENEVETNQLKPNEDMCRCSDRPPERPPKPSRLDYKLNNKPPMPLPLSSTCSCRNLNKTEENLNRIGPYENYDVPKMSVVEVETEYYDTPKRLKECLNSELFKITKSSTPNSLILKKPCGCVLKFGKRKHEPTIIDCEENIQPASCPCQRVTNWAHTWIKLPYCNSKKTANTDRNCVVPNKENVMPNSKQSDLYATVDISRKTKKNLCVNNCKVSGHVSTNCCQTQNPGVEIEDGPLANYVNLNFALSLEYYENAKDVLRKAGVTQSELDAISANLNPDKYVLQNNKPLCSMCGHERSKSQEAITAVTSDDYLMMVPNNNDSIMKSEFKVKSMLPPGYTPMSPIGDFSFHTLKHPAKSSINKVIEEKSASNPTLFDSSSDAKRPLNAESDSDLRGTCPTDIIANRDRITRIKHRKRSCSADSSRLLEDVKEFDSSVGSRGSTSSLETLRNMTIDRQRTSTPFNNSESEYCENSGYCAKLEGKSSDLDSSDASKELPQLRSKTRQSPQQIKRSWSAPCKAGPNRDSSSSNDSGVSSCSLRHGPDFLEFELPLTTARTRHRYLCAQRARTSLRTPLSPRSSPRIMARRSRSSDPVTEITSLMHEVKIAAKSSSAEAEVPVLSTKPLRGAAGVAGVGSVADSRSTSSGTSDMSDYIETLSLCSSHSSTDTPPHTHTTHTTLRINRQSTSSLRPRSGAEYRQLEPRRATPLHLPHNLPQSLSQTVPHSLTHNLPHHLPHNLPHHLPHNLPHHLPHRLPHYQHHIPEPGTR